MMLSYHTRQGLLRDAVLRADADVVCFQEASGRSDFEDDFRFMTEAGYRGALASKGRMRCATFWRPEAASPAEEPVSKDRTLIIPFRLAAGGALLWVVNAHLSAGPDPGRRLRQTHEALETVRKLRGRMGPEAGSGPPAVVFCGDLNADDELQGSTAVHKLLSEGRVEKGFVDPFHPGLGAITSKNRRQQLGELRDAYRLAFAEPPPTIVGPLFTGRLGREGDRSAPTEALEASLDRMFARYARPAAGPAPAAMDQAGVEAWLLDVNREIGRGSEYRAAMAALERNGDGLLTREEFGAIYAAELAAGKPWGVAHDLWATSSAEGCLPADGAELGTFEGRFDHIYFTPATLELEAVRETLKTAGEDGGSRQGVALANEWSASDHLPIGATLAMK